MKRYILIFFTVNLLSQFSAWAQKDTVWTLEECISYAYERNIQIRKSELSNQRYQYLSDQAKAQRFPSLNASLNQNYDWSRSDQTTSAGFTGTYGSNLSLSSGITIFNASKLTNQIIQSELDIEGGTLFLEAAKESVSLAILDAYLQVLYAEEQVKNSRKQIESTSRQLDLAAERLELQIISQSDYAQIKSQLASEKLTLANAESQLAIAKVNLEQLMELPVSKDFNIEHPEFPSSVNQNRIPDVNLIYETALSIKPEIKNAEINKKIASLDEKIAKAGFYPVLSMSAGIGTGYSNKAADSYFTQFDRGFSPSVGLSLSVPIYQKRQVKTNVAIARIDYQDALLSELNTRNELRKKIEQACLDVTSAQVQYEASLEKFNATKESAALSDEKFRQGMINSVDYLVSKTNLILAESEFLQARFNLIFSYKVLDFYSGIPLSL